MKKLYLFGDSFSLLDEHLLLENNLNLRIENNAHSSLSNDHILKLTKIKLNKLIEQQYFDCNVLVQLTVPERLLLIYNDTFETLLSTPKNLEYLKKNGGIRDEFLFENKMYSTLYPYLGWSKDPLIKNLYSPYCSFIYHNNYYRLLKDLILELKILSNLSKSVGINFEYLFFTNDYEFHLNYDLELNSEHIKFGEYNCIETYLRENNKSDHFVSKNDKHLNDTGNKWYLKFLMERYDI
jgi:hypothetical protein